MTPHRVARSRAAIVCRAVSNAPTNDGVSRSASSIW